jgi:SAM-dependent methyltransferase
VFWGKARRIYKNVTADDEDICRYFRLAGEFQKSGYYGLTGRIQNIGHHWVARHTRPGKVLEIGSGTGQHAKFFRGSKDDIVFSEYAAYAFASGSLEGELAGRMLRCDARQLPFAANTFDTVISIYNLEHIKQLQSVFQEVHRVLRGSGAFLIALPCEGGFAWNFGRELTTRRRYTKRYGINYDKVIAFEHVWDFRGVVGEILKSRLFEVRRRVFFPFGVPTPHLNLIACLELCRRREALSPR